MYSITKSSQRRDRGFTLIETLTYGVGLIIILAGIVSFLFFLYGWYRTATIPARGDAAGLALMNQIVMDVRAANTLNDLNSNYDTQNGQISMTTSSGANATTTVYSLQNGQMQSKVGSAATTTISAGDMRVSGFYIKKLPTPNSMAARIEIDVDYFINGATSTNVYTDLAILRQSY